MDQINKAANPFSAAKLAKLPKHKSFVPAKGAAGKFTPGKRSAGPAEGPLTRRLTALKKNDTVSAFGVDHAVEIEKFSFGGAGLKALGGARKFGAGAGAKLKKVGTGMQSKARAKPGVATMTSSAQHSAGGAAGKLGQTMINNPLKTTAAITAGGAGTAAVGGSAVNRKKY